MALFKPVDVQKVRVASLPEPERSMAREISDSPLGDGSSHTISELEVHSAVRYADRMELSETQEDALARLAQRLGVNAPHLSTASFKKTVAEVLGPERVEADGTVARRTRIISTVGPA